MVMSAVVVDIVEIHRSCWSHTDSAIVAAAAAVAAAVGDRHIEAVEAHRIQEYFLRSLLCWMIVDRENPVGRVDSICACAPEIQNY
jgi:hypothetical protein